MENGTHAFIPMMFSKQVLLPLDNVQIIFPTLEFRLSFSFLLTTMHTRNHIAFLPAKKKSLYFAIS